MKKEMNYVKTELCGKITCIFKEFDVKNLMKINVACEK